MHANDLLFGYKRVGAINHNEMSIDLWWATLGNVGWLALIHNYIQNFYRNNIAGIKPVQFYILHFHTNQGRLFQTLFFVVAIVRVAYFICTSRNNYMLYL